MALRHFVHPSPSAGVKESEIWHLFSTTVAFESPLFGKRAKNQKCKLSVGASMFTLWLPKIWYSSVYSTLRTIGYKIAPARSRKKRAGKIC